MKKQCCDPRAEELNTYSSLFIITFSEGFCVSQSEMEGKKTVSRGKKQTKFKTLRVSNRINRYVLHLLNKQNKTFSFIYLTS